MAEIGTVLRTIIEARDVSQPEFAAHVGLTRKHLTRITSGRDKVGPGLAGKLLRAVEEKFGSEPATHLLQTYMAEELRKVLEGGDAKTTSSRYRVVVERSGKQTSKDEDPILGIPSTTARKLGKFFAEAREDSSMVTALEYFLDALSTAHESRTHRSKSKPARNR